MGDREGEGERGGEEGERREGGREGGGEEEGRPGREKGVPDCDISNSFYKLNVHINHFTSY